MKEYTTTEYKTKFGADLFAEKVEKCLTTGETAENISSIYAVDNGNIFMVIME